MSVFFAFWLGVLLAVAGGVLVYREHKWPGSTSKLIERLRK